MSLADRIAVWLREVWPALLSLGACAVVLLLVTPASNPYDGPLRLARALLGGSGHLDSYLDWMEMFRHAGRDQLAYPPMVSFLLVPFVWLLGEGVGQPALNSLFMLVTAGLLTALVRGIRPIASMAPWAAPAYLLGTPLLYSAANGNTWLLMHTEGNILLASALVAALRLRSAALAGFLFVAALQARYSIALAAPALLATLVVGDHRPLRTLYRALPALVGGGLLPLAVVLIFQWLTLGDAFLSPYEVGWQEWGLRGPRFSTAYIGANLEVYFLHTPQLLPTFPWLRFGAEGQSLLVLSPFLFFVFASRLSVSPLAVFAACCVAMLGFYLLYFGTGSAQYGNRYAQDLLPLLIPLALSAATRPQRLWRIGFGLLLAFSVLMNAWGTYVVAGLELE